MRAQDNGKEHRGGPAAPRPRQPRVPGWAAGALALQRLAGNAAVSRAIAEERHSHAPGCGHAEPSVQRRVSPGDAIATPGRPLPARIVARMEQEYPMAFGHVRLHDGPVARRSAADHGSVAYTTGSHIVSGRPALDDETLFHEAGHVWQQAMGTVAGTDDGTGTKVSSPGDPFEVQAAENGRRMARGAAPDLALPGVPAAEGAVQRAAEESAGQVQRAAEESAGQVRRVAGGAPAQAPPQPGLPPDIRAALGKEIPDYWNELQWTDSGSGYCTAVLPRGHRVWAAVEKYARLSQERAPVTAPKGEATRMEESRKRLADPALTDEQRVSHTRRLQEGGPGGPPPPSSARMDIVEIVVCASPALWEKYATNRQLYHQSLVSHGKKGLTAARRDRSERIPWSVGSRPDLDGQASTSVRPEYPRPDRLPPAVPQNAGEAFFWHGTSTRVMDLINANGPAPELGRNKGTAAKPHYGVLGQGTYVADNASKAQTYFACPRCEDPECTDATHPPRELMLMRGLIGSPDFAHLGDSRRAEDHKTLKDGRTSVVSPGIKKNPARLGPTGTNEFLIKDKALLYPEIRVRYRRSTA